MTVPIPSPPPYEINRLRVVVTPDGPRNISIRAEYWGGPYIDLTFGVTDPDSPASPTEVINVWDDELGEPYFPLSNWANSNPNLRAAVLHGAVYSWIADQDLEVAEFIADHPEDEPWDWYQAYLDNR